MKFPFPVSQLGILHAIFHKTANSVDGGAAHIHQSRYQNDDCGGDNADGLLSDSQGGKVN